MEDEDFDDEDTYKQLNAIQDHQMRQDPDTRELAALRAEIDDKMGFVAFTDGDSKLGWLVNIQPVLYYLMLDFG